MAKFLVVIGIIMIFLSVIFGFMTSSFSGFLISLGSGIASAAIFFALAMILDNQQLILTRIQQLPKPSKEKAVCSRCGKQYDGDMNSCPHCGYRK